MMARLFRVLPLLLGVPLLAGVLAMGSPALASSNRPIRSCGSFKVLGWPVTKVRVANATCAQAQRIMVRYHETGQGLSCLTFGDDGPVRIRCRGRIPVAGPEAGGTGRRFVQVVIDFSLPECAAAGDCGI